MVRVQYIISSKWNQIHYSFGYSGRIENCEFMLGKKVSSKYIKDPKDAFYDGCAAVKALDNIW